MTVLDLTLEEQAHTRNALHFLRAKLGTWAMLAKVLHFDETTLIKAGSARTVTASMAFRIARVLDIAVDDLVKGRLPEPGTCPRCGYRNAHINVRTSTR